MSDLKVTIRVNKYDHEVRPGPWIVKDLKAAVGVDPAKVLAKITPMGLERSSDNSVIEISAGMSFISHARAGGAS